MAVYRMSGATSFCHSDRETAAQRMTALHTHMACLVSRPRRDTSDANPSTDRLLLFLTLLSRKQRSLRRGVDTMVELLLRIIEEETC